MYYTRKKAIKIRTMLESRMPKSRIEAFSDGVLAIIITIMVLEMKVPHGASFETLRPVVPVFFSYVLSFVYIAIYWSNHHHLLHAAKSGTVGILWANLHLLFWLSLVPFVSGWWGENHGAALPTALYGVVLLGAAVAYFILQGFVVAGHGAGSKLAKAVGRDWKGKVSLLSYGAAVGLAFKAPVLADLLYIGVALMWLVPDKRMEAGF